MSKQPTAKEQEQYESERKFIRELLVACEKDEVDKVKSMQRELSSKGVSVCDYRDGKRAGAVHAAARGGALKTLEYLLSLKPEQAALADGEGRTPLLAACNSEAGADCVRFLLQTSQAARDSVNVSTHGACAIHHAASLDSAKALQYLLELGAASPMADSNAGTPLHWAAAHAGTTDTMAALIRTKQVDVNAQNNEGSTSLIIACLRGRADMVKVLCDAGADLAAFAGNLSPLIASVVTGKLECVKAVLEKGGDALCMVRDPEENLLPIEHAAHADHEDIVQYLAPKSGMAGLDSKAFMKKIQDEYELKLQAEAKRRQEADAVANVQKESGNKLFLEQKFAEAIAKYREATHIPHISLDMKATLLCNISACHLKANALQEARDAAEEAKKVEPGHVKAHYRLGQACAALKDHASAAQAFYDAYNLDKGSKDAEGLLHLFKRQIDLGKAAHAQGKLSS